jgi:hypothetical protein
MQAYNVAFVGLQRLDASFQSYDAGLHCHDVGLQCGDVIQISAPS